jgi:hypothetical protein
MNPMPIAAVQSLAALQAVLCAEESFGFTTVGLWASNRADMPNFAAFRRAEAGERSAAGDTVALERVVEARNLGPLVAARAAKGWRLSLFTTVQIAADRVGVAVFHRVPAAK